MASRAEYLKRYLGGGDAGGGPERKRRRKRDAPTGAAGVRILDQDVNDWRHARPGARQAQEREEDEEAPVVANAGGAEVGALPSRSDGSGWVQLPPACVAGNADLSPPRRGRQESSFAVRGGGSVCAYREPYAKAKRCAPLVRSFRASRAALCRAGGAVSPTTPRATRL